MSDINRLKELIDAQLTAAGHDHDIRNLVLEYDLQIIPVLIKFDSHSLSPRSTSRPWRTGWTSASWDL